MTTNYYPVIDNELLEILLENVRHTEGYLDDPDCPYSDRVKVLLTRIMSEDVALEDLEDLDLVYESTRLFKELKDQKEKLGQDDHSEAMAYFRTSTQLMEKLISYRERANNVKQISQFYATVLATMERHLEADQITEIRNELQEYAQ